jgi:hypothetical protein
MFQLAITKKVGQSQLLLAAAGEDFQMRFADAIVRHSRRIMDESVPSGRIYRRRKFKRGQRVQGVRARGPGQMFHRASAKGQPPAKDTGRLYNKIRAVRTGRGRVLVKFDAPYVGFLEFRMDRPFVIPAIEAAAREIFGGEVQ